MRDVSMLAVVAAAFVWAAPALAGNGIYDVSIDGNTATADVSLGGVSATLTIRFENVVGLNADNLGLSARLVDPVA